MEHGIDVSENNGVVDWNAVWSAGIDFAIIRLGYGRGHLDERFLENLEGAKKYGIKVGVYYYSYALDVEDARDEARFTAEVLKQNGIVREDLQMGVWFDMEDADGWKVCHGMPDDKTITDMCIEYTDFMRYRAGFKCGVYASSDWLENIIDYDAFDNVPLWVAQWNSELDFEGDAYLWQHTDSYDIDGCAFDANYVFD